MNKEIIYLVEIHSGGNYDSLSYVEFATKNKDYAINWAEKFNKILNKWKPYFDDLAENNIDFLLKNDWAYWRFEQLHNLDFAIVVKTELR